jgi:hypothetical protein
MEDGEILVDKCKRCESERLAYICGKCSDMCSFSDGTREMDGYSPQNVGLVNSYGDYVEFGYCLDCGQIQGKFPVSKAAVDRVFVEADNG